MASTDTIRRYIRILFGACCVFWMLVGLDHYQNDGAMFDYEYLSSTKMRKLLSAEESYTKWNTIVEKKFQEEFQGTNVKEKDRETLDRILEMIKDDNDAIKDNSEQFHKKLPEYIIAKRQARIQEYALAELEHKKRKEEKKFSQIKKATKKEQSGIEQISETGNKDTASHKKLEDDLEHEEALLSEQIESINHLIHNTRSMKIHWEKEADKLHTQLFGIMQLDKKDRAIESALKQLIHYSNEKICNWNDNQKCEFKSSVDVGIQFDSHIFIVQNPPNSINLKSMHISKETENVHNQCEMKVLIGINEACAANSDSTDDQNPLHDNVITPETICTVKLDTLHHSDEGCHHCNGINFDLKELKKAQLPSAKQHEPISTFCITMKRYYPHYTGHLPTCKSDVEVNLEPVTSGKLRIHCPKQKSKPVKHQSHTPLTAQSHIDQHESQTHERSSNEPHLRNLPDRQSFGLRKYVGFWAYGATILCGVAGLFSLFMVLQ